MARRFARALAAALLALSCGLLLASLGQQATAQVTQINLLTTTTRPRPTTTTSTTTSTTSTVPAPTTSISVAPPTTRPAPTTSTVAPTTAAPTTTTSTTIAQLPAPAPPPATLPLGTASQSGSINSYFPILSGIGIVGLLVLLTVQWFLTRPGRRGPTL